MRRSSAAKRLRAKKNAERSKTEHLISERLRPNRVKAPGYNQRERSGRVPGCSTRVWVPTEVRLVNARVETIDTAPSYRQAFEKRRCLIPADGFYEWRTIGGMKIPFSVGMNDDRPFVFAGLWEGWKDPATEEWLRTCTIITGDPNELVAVMYDEREDSTSKFENGKGESSNSATGTKK
jgi:putative SOS response-associated peptidase YedK